MYKHHIWEISFSGVIAGKTKSYQSIRLNEFISLIVCIWTDNQKRRTSHLITFLMRCLGMPRYIQSSTWAWRISDSCSFSENGIGWKIKRKEKSRYTFLGSQVIRANPFAYLYTKIYWSLRHPEEIAKWVHIRRCSVGVNNKRKT